MTKPGVVREATEADLIGFLGEVPSDCSAKAVVVELDGKVVGLGGLAVYPSTATAFAEYSDELQALPRLFVEGARAFIRMLQAHDGPIYSYRDLNEPTSDRLLRFCGFDPINDEVYEWSGQ